MDKKVLIKTHNERFLDRRLKTLTLIAFLILAWVAVIHFFSEYIKKDSADNWQKIESEKIEQQSSFVSNLFAEYQSGLDNLSIYLSKNPDIVKQIQRSDSKKLFEELNKLDAGKQYQVEIYNTRLELLSFKGRRLDSDVYSLQRSINGKKFSVLKEVGFYTYLIIYSPVYDSKDKSQLVGVILTSKLIDIENQINNKFFQNIGFLNEVNKSLQVSSEIIPANIISGKIDTDSSALADKVSTNLKGLEGNTIGIMLFPKYNEVMHDQNIEALSKKIISFLIFGLTIILFLISLKFLKGIRNPLLKFIFFAAVITVIRFIWLEFSFPAKSISSEIFTAGFYASSFGFGIAKSLGEFLITSAFVLMISLYGIRLVSDKNINLNLTGSESKLFIHFTNLCLILIFFGLIYLFGSLIESIVLDSNLKFFDRSSIIPDPELFIIQLIILILAFSLFVCLVSAVILIIRNSSSEFSRIKFFGKYSYLPVLLILLILNQIIAAVFDNFKVDYLYRFLIIVFTFTFGVYAARKIILSKSYNIFSVKNFSLIILFCIVTVPGILLDKITSQETYFVEIIGRKITEREDDRIRFLLMTELSNFSENKNVESNLKTKNKLTELAFSVWSDSKFSEENLNTAVIVLDTNHKLLSDFVFNSRVLNPDSIISYSEDNFFRKIDIYSTLNDTSSVTDTLYADDSEEEDEYEFSGDSNSEDLSNLFITENIVILKNETDKYYLGIIPLEKIGLRKTTFQTTLGYLLIAVQYENRNFLTQSSMQLFKNYSRDNLFDKLISTPIITEYQGGEIVSSTNQDLSKSNTMSLGAFREAIKFKEDKSDWRYETINNERYRTFYIVASPGISSGTERIFSISLKRNDFTLTTFFYLKFILFVVSVYLFILVVISFLLLYNLRKFRLHFREKLFASFFIVSVIPIVLLAVYTRSFIKTKYDLNFQNEIISDLNLISQSFKANRISLNSLDSLSKEQNRLLTNSLSQTDKNFNLFLKTKLVSTTNDELYKSDLLDTRVDEDAYYNIVYLRKDFFSKTEEIGDYSFVVGYKPFFDPNNNIIGIMSSQTVYKQNEINEELTEILTFIFGIYFIVIIILLVFVTFLTDRISKPILKLQNATDRISQGYTNVELKIDSKDEIGNLVDSFNKMSKELESSKDKLKKAEREAAWRDIARRVAHEIKNPLTPMKLSIQHLFDVYNNGKKDNFPEVLKKTRNIIINEIDKLNRIATEFSNFAKLSGTNYEEVSLNKIIEEVVSLYRLAPNIDFKESLDYSIENIYADRQELNRVFQNLIKNSIQAIELNGEIEVKTYKKDGYIFAEVIDNGSGIDKVIMKDLFEPNFSTKSTGMGLGLAIAKKTLDEMKAGISFDSSADSGTKVTIRFNPYVNVNKSKTLPA